MELCIIQVSGTAADLEEDLSAELDIVGRINPDTVWDYIGKMKRASNKEIVILRLQAANDEEKMQYIALYSYLSSRNRFVPKSVSKIKIICFDNFLTVITDSILCFYFPILTPSILFTHENKITKIVSVLVFVDALHACDDVMLLL